MYGPLTTSFHSHACEPQTPPPPPPPDPEGADPVMTPADWAEVRRLLRGHRRDERPRLADVALLVLPKCVGFQARKASRTVTRLFDRMTRARVGLRSTQIHVLSAILVSRGRADMTYLAESLFMDRSTLSRAVKRLRARGLVDIRTVPTDLRLRIPVLTQAAIDALEIVVRAWIDCQRELWPRLGDGRRCEQAALSRHLAGECRWLWLMRGLFRPMRPPHGYWGHWQPRPPPPSPGPAH